MSENLGDCRQWDDLHRYPQRLVGLHTDPIGWTDPKPAAKAWAKLEQAHQPLLQLYDMTQDIGEQSNRVQDHPEVVQRLLELLRHQVSRGRSTPGPDQTNDIEVTIEKRPGNEASDSKASD